MHSLPDLLEEVPSIVAQQPDLQEKRIEKLMLSTIFFFFFFDMIQGNVFIYNRFSIIC